ncbi:MAG: hypothetical protein HPY45_00535 [Anaerolineae bacterium]|nr:hypothetical protein [Anaerolineae bacterium]
MIRPKIGTYAVYEPTEEGWESWSQQLQQINSDLADQGLEIISAPEAVRDEDSCRRVAAWFASQQVDLLHPLIITWSFDHYTVLIHQSAPLPVAIRTIPGIRTGSIVGGQQLGNVLTDIEVEHRLLYGALGSQETARETAIYARACALRQKLRGARFLLIGRRTPGMSNIAIDELEILRLLGIVLTTMGMDEFNLVVEKVSPAQAEAEWQKVSTRAAEVSCNPQQAIASMKHYVALKQLIAQYQFQSITIGSYPACQGVACLPLALLDDEGIATGCGEGDVNSAIAKYLLMQLSDAPGHFGEMLEIDESANSIVTSHCGAGAPSLADQDGYILCPVRLAHSGVCIRYKARPGPITYVNLVGRRSNYRMCAIEGNAVHTEMVFEGNPMRIVLKTPLRNLWQAVSQYGFGHHWMAGYAHVANELSVFCHLTGIKGIFPDIDP